MTAPASLPAPGVPTGDGSLATTRITMADLPPNARPRDITHVTPEHPHWSLILMTVLTQLSVGGFLVGLFRCVLFCFRLFFRGGLSQSPAAGLRAQQRKSQQQAPNRSSKNRLHGELQFSGGIGKVTAGTAYSDFFGT